ncbi:CU044_5270 family protein [Streptomyces sp. NBC_00280]|uniref:CU044_5270 family protein n=1 Tax=Streptomyces sp. NBC_00280 TaxID=2975699 RepID=UPI0032430DFF
MKLEKSETAERADAAAVLPAFPYPEPAPELFHAHKQNLLRQIDQQTGSVALQRVARRRRMGMVVASAAVACVAVVVTGLSITATEPPAETPPASKASVQLLEQAALAAVADPGAVPRSGQYTYVKVTGHTTALSEGKDGSMERLRQDESYEQWTSVDGSGRTMQRKPGGSAAWLPVPAPGEGSLNLPTYRFLAGLPTEPGALLETIYRDANLNHGAGSDSTTGPDQEAFVTIGDLLRASVAPPDVSAALFRAAARIPGVIVVSDAVDAAGRHGVAVAREHDGERFEWIFDKDTKELLGERTVLVEGNAWGKAGTPVTSTAVTRSGIVDKAGQEPASGSGQGSHSAA